MKRLILTSLCVLFAANFAWADWIDLPVKWGQEPALGDGYGHLSNHPSNITRADDFMCYDPKPIVAVRWWGSYAGETVSRDEEDGFWKSMDISFYFSDLAPHPNSLPDGPYLSLQTVLAQEWWVGYDFMGAPVYEYNAYLVNPFSQTPGEEYFIGIDDPIEATWCWHEAYYQQLDFHAKQSPNHTGSWTTDPEYVDLAFDLMVVPEPATVVLLGLGALSLLRRKRRA